jgi:hypothetical protein
MLKTICAFGLLACGLAAAADTAPVPVCTAVPGWTQRGEARSYVGDNLFEYMDGNAEGYLIYGFQSMHGVTCVNGPVTLVIDISDFGEPDLSYGMFTANRDLREPMAKLGAGGQIVPRRAIFTKGQYYVEIAASPEGDHTATLQEWMAAFEKVVPGSTSPPVALTWFPAEKQQTLRLVPESVLGIRLLRRGYAAQYDYGKAFVVTEATPESAGGVLQKLRARFAATGETTAATVADEAFQANDKYLGRLCFFRKGRYVGGYANVADGQNPVDLSVALAAKLP